MRIKVGTSPVIKMQSLYQIHVCESMTPLANMSFSFGPDLSYGGNRMFAAFRKGINIFSGGSSRKLQKITREK